MSNKRNTLQFLRILSIIIGLAAFCIAIIAIIRQEYVIALAMILVGVWQFFNFVKWKKLV